MKGCGLSLRCGSLYSKHAACVAQVQGIRDPSVMQDIVMRIEQIFDEDRKALALVRSLSLKGIGGGGYATASGTSAERPGFFWGI